jgi:tetratricopeptide (TPR) repeat protein
MRKILGTICLCFLLVAASAQDNDPVKIVAKGVELHDKGDYKGAIREYEKALSIDANSSLANSEMATTYFAMKEYDKAIEYSDRVIAAHGRYLDNAYVTKGSAMDLKGKPQEAIAIYKKGIEEYPKSYYLYYNLAMTSYSVKEYEQAEQALEKGLRLKPGHASSHLLMGFVMNDMGDRVKALLALYNYLLLEPGTPRSKQALALADQLMKRGVVHESEKKTSIYMPSPGGKDEFSGANFWLSMLEAGKNMKENKKKSDCELFMDNSKAFLGLLNTFKKDNAGFWWNYYADFYTALFKDKGREETFGYIISASWDDKKVNAWLKKNKSRVDGLAEWNDALVRK